VDFLVHDLNEPFPDSLRNQFDVVVSAEVIEHTCSCHGRCSSVAVRHSVKAAG